MVTEIVNVTQFTQDFIPFELFILIFIFGMISLILSICAKKGNIFFSALSTVLSIFLVYSTFFLRWNTTFIPTSVSKTDTVETILEITNVNQMFLSTPLLWLLIGLFAFSIVSLWMNVAYYSQKALKDAVKKNKNIPEDRMV